MNRKLVIGLTLILLFFLGLKAEAEGVGKPEILDSGVKKGIHSASQLFVSGITEKNTEVLIYLDGNYVDSARIIDNQAYKNSFYFEYGAVKSGEHILFAIAKDRTSLVLSPLAEKKIIIPPLPAPTLLNVDYKLENGGKIVAKIATPSGTGNEIFLDGELLGETKKNEDESGTVGYIYEKNKKISSGKHEISVTAKDENGYQSISDVMDFEVAWPTPKPVLLAVNKTLDSKIIVIGLARNDLKIQFFVDKKASSELEIKNNSSGTVNFSIQLAGKMKRGRHSIYAVAYDIHGKKSEPSNVFDFTLNSPMIADSASDQAEIVKINEPLRDSINSPLVIFPKIASGTLENQTCAESAGNQNKIDDKNSSKKLAAQNVEQPAGLINENRNKFNKLNLSSIVFILFLFSITSWIIWVNKKIVK